MSAEQQRRWYHERGGREKKRVYNLIHREYQNQKDKERWKRKKRILVDMLGGKCKRCGYFQLSGLMFHHNGKKMDCVSNLRQRSFELLKEELKDAELLCMNCHTELHYGWLDS